MLVASAALLPAFLRTRAELRWHEGLAAGALGVTAYYAAFNIGLRDARATDASVIQAAIPAATALVAIPVLREHGSGRTWAGIILSIAGAVVLVGATSAAGEGSLVGDLWMVVTVAVWALYSVYVRRLARRAGDMAITAATLLWGTVLLLPFGAVELTQIAPRLTASGVAAVLFLGVLASALGYWLWSYGLARVEAGRATSYLNLLPLVGALSGVLVLGERIGIAEVVGGALIIGGVALANRGR